MIHFVLHDPRDTVAVVVVEGVTAGQDVTGWIILWLIVLILIRVYPCESAAEFLSTY